MKGYTIFPDTETTLPREHFADFLRPEPDEYLENAIRDRDFSQVGLLLTESDHLPSLTNTLPGIRTRQPDEIIELCHSPAAMSIYLAWHFAASMSWLTAEIIEGTKFGANKTRRNLVSKIKFQFEQALLHSFGMNGSLLLDEDRATLAKLQTWNETIPFAPWSVNQMLEVSFAFSLLRTSGLTRSTSPWSDKNTKDKELNKLLLRCRKVLYTRRFVADNSLSDLFEPVERS